jgi:transcriptional regulator with XRE-family HTH domain/Zn-dependent peptidase ImmA (M78 family)
MAAAHSELSWSEIGRRVREARLVAGLSQAELAEAVGLERSMIAKVEAGTRHVNALELIRLASILVLPLDHLLRQQPEVVSRRARVVEEGLVTDAARDSFRLEVVLLAWHRDIRQLVEAGMLETPSPRLYPQAVASEADARAAAHWLRTELGIADGPLPSLMEVCHRAGQLVLVTDLPGEGASLVDGDIAAAVVSRRSDPGRRRATAAHELGHLVLGDEYSSDLGVNISRDDREQVIDAFAAELLLPERVVAAAVGGTKLFDRASLVKLAAMHRASWTLAVRQAVRAGAVDRTEGGRWSAATPTRAELLEAAGWVPQPDLEETRVPSAYADAVMAAWRRGLVTSARAIELMHGQIEESDLPVLDDSELAP